MALIPCPDCKKMISENAEKCPKCGRIIMPEDVDKWRNENEERKRKKKKLMPFFVAGIVLIFAISALTDLLFPSKPASTEDVLTKVKEIVSEIKDVEVYQNDEDPRIICVDQTIDGTAAGIAALKLIGPSGDWSAWDKLTESSTDLCRVIKNNVDDMGRDDLHIVYSIKNDLNADNIFFSVMDGSVIYNAKND